MQGGDIDWRIYFWIEPISLLYIYWPVVWVYTEAAVCDVKTRVWKEQSYHPCNFFI